VSALNRAVAVIVALIVLAGAIILVLVAANAIEPDDLPSGWADRPLDRADVAVGGTKAAFIAVSLVVALAMIVLLFLELATTRRPLALLIGSDETGTTTIDQDSVRVLAEKTAAAARNVREVKCEVAEKVGGLVIHSRASVAMGSNIPEVSAEIKGKIKEAVQQFTGLPVAQVNVKAKYESVEARRLAVS
jgi:uncharacterized alkaline shock family protein YloU